MSKHKWSFPIALTRCADCGKTFASRKAFEAHVCWLERQERKRS
jgi:uncharacterized C2H2 Zn-finger protein